MSRYSRWTRARALALAIAAGYAVAACGGAADSTGPGGGNGDKPAANDLFVSATTGNDAGGGTEQTPFQTIAAALAASDSGQTIRVAGGAYVERVVLKSYVHIVGGYDPDNWQRDTVHDSTTIGDSVMTVVGLHVSDVVLDGLHLRNLAGSNYGVVTFDSSAGIEIVGSTISAPRGFTGNDGFGWGTTRPAQAADGSSGAKGGTCLLGTKAGGAGGSATWGGSDGGQGGLGQLNGGADGQDGPPSSVADGGGGGKGGSEFHDGAGGGSPSVIPETGPSGNGGSPGFGGYTIVDGYYSMRGSYGQYGLDGTGGGGGGGGGGDAIIVQCGGGGGGGGQGGVAGGVGSPGMGGGPAIGLVVGRASDVRLVNSTVITGGGGSGGAGARGELGGLPGGGGAGGAAAGGGGAGGAGGAGIEGARGGPGGGGAGGASVGVLVFPSGVYTPTGVVYHVGPGGAGGVGGESSVDTSVGVPGDSASVKNLTG